MQTEHTCGTCRHWGTDYEVSVTVPDNGPFGRVSLRRAPCLCDAVEPDAGYGAVVLLGPDSHCAMHADAWEPLADAEACGDVCEPCAVYGVRPGVDFPATLHR